MKNRNKFFEIIFAAAAVLFAGCSNSINPQEKSLPGTVIIKPVLPGQGARYVSPELDTPNMIYYYYAKKVSSQTPDNNSHSDEYSGFLENKSFSDALKNSGYNVGNTVKVADGEYFFNVLGYTVSTPESITNVISDIQKLGNSNAPTQGQDLPSKFTVSGFVKVDCTNKTTVTVPMFWNGDYTGLGITTTTTTVTSSYPNVKVVDALDFSYQFQSDDNSYANGDNGTASAPTYDFCLRLTECIAQPNTEPIIVELKNTDVNGNGVNNLIVEEKQIESGVITTTVKINPACTEVITAGLWNIGFYKGREIVSAYQYNTVMLVPGVKTTFNLDFNSNSPTSSVFVKIPKEVSETNSGIGTLLSPFTKFQYSLDTLENFPNCSTEVLLSDVEHNTPEFFNESCFQRIVLDLNGFTLSAGIDVETDSAYPFTACNSTIKNGRVEAHLEMTNGGSLENVTFPGGSEASSVISDANIITVSGYGDADVTNSIVYSFNNVTADYIQIKNPGVIIDSLVNGTNNIKGIIIGEKGLNNLPTIAKSWRIGNPNTDFRKIKLFKYEEDLAASDGNTFNIVDATDYKIEKGCIVYNAEPMGFIQENSQFSFFNLDSGNNFQEIKVNPPLENVNLQYATSTFDLNGYPWVLLYNPDYYQVWEYYIVNQDYSVNCKVLNLPDPGYVKTIAVDNNYLYLCYEKWSPNSTERYLKRVSFENLAVGSVDVDDVGVMESLDCPKTPEVMVATGSSELYFIYSETNEETYENKDYLSKVVWGEPDLIFDANPICLNDILDQYSPKPKFNTNDYIVHYDFDGADAKLKEQGYVHNVIPPSSDVTIGEYKFCDLAYSNGKLYIPVDFKSNNKSDYEMYPVAISTGNIVVYDLKNEMYEILGQKFDFNTNKISIDLPSQTIEYTDPIPATPENYTLTGYYPTADTPNMFYGVNKILAVKKEKIIFSDAGYCFLVDDFEKWKKALASGNNTPYTNENSIEVKNINRALIYENNDFKTTDIPQNYIYEYYNYFASNSIVVGGIYDCKSDICSYMHELRYQFRRK